MKISHVAGFGPIVASKTESNAFYNQTLGIAWDRPGEDYPMTDTLPGVNHFALWTLQECANACFGTDEWPGELIVPQAGIEFDVASGDEVSSAADELVAAGYHLLVAPKTEPWGQVVARLQRPEGLLVSITYTPWQHDPK